MSRNSSLIVLGSFLTLVTVLAPITLLGLGNPEAGGLLAIAVAFAASCFFLSGIGESKLLRFMGYGSFVTMPVCWLFFTGTEPPIDLYILVGLAGLLGARISDIGLQYDNNTETALSPQSPPVVISKAPLARPLAAIDSGGFTLPTL